eukprot:CAMPEP_0196766108 /NCGR_PEP_ID=MMETSP1095-20130614/18631_1 /TAXON_ID=96789 ORGANISM="Chromulina nebulosa, Strain UTEXLB2642" /NCGR_SAMPLE_ID=MMETSP1095 /ASSEMBLY_ACC=CAM_ASM_000446 /LENGTH=658 /DNA_ID=CAMNT_0042126301 /DNA_START=118 /DNA_END=2091 /DNA_ORIENTATION=-
MSEKLLSKPPFRFLHDTISAIMAVTGFGDGLYNSTELDSAQINDRNTKVAYLDKIFLLVGICKGETLAVNSGKVVAGSEPENTNLFLIALAEVSIDSSIDSALAVRMTLSGSLPSPDKIPRKNTRGNIAESKVDEQISDSKPSRPPPDETKSSKAIESNVDIDSNNGIPDRGRSRGGTRGGKPNQASTDTGLSRSNNIPNLDKEIEKCDGLESTTQLLLGELIQRPKLTDKLLGKPPFKFLFDIVVEVIRVTGFGTGLYTNEELEATITEKPQKIQFLDKIIQLVGTHLNTLVEAKPNKIVTGQEAQNTNIFLQLLAVAAKHVPDSTNSVRLVLESLNQNTDTNINTNTNNNSSNREDVPIRGREEKTNDDVSKSTTRQHSSSVSEPKEDLTPNIRNEERREIIPPSEEKFNDDGDGEVKKSIRPMTAGRRPPKVKESTVELSAKDIAPIAKKTEGILIDGQNDDDDDDLVADGKRLADDVKSSKQTDIQSKLVKNIITNKAEREAAINQPIVNETEDSKVAEESKGTGIRLGKIKKTGDKKGNVITSSTPSGGFTSFNESDIERVRSAIQLLVQNTGPLGVCMDYIQEDVGLMATELRKWEEECRKYEDLLAVETLKTRDALQPLQSELADIEEQIGDHIAKISSMKATIARNDDNI